MATKGTRISVVLAVFAAALLCPPAVRAADGQPIEDAVLNEKCNLCHSSKRIYTMDPTQIKPVLEKMQRKNPDWITDVNSEHIATVLASILGDASVVAMRKAWTEAVERGERLFEDANLGTNGKSCSSCHAEVTMKWVGDAYPQYDPALRRLVTLEERVASMVAGQLAGEALPAGDQRLIDLIAYLKSHR